MHTLAICPYTNPGQIHTHKKIKTSKKKKGEGGEKVERKVEEREGEKRESALTNLYSACHLSPDLCLYIFDVLGVLCQCFAPHTT